jgi:hypothetical protein
VWGTTPPPLHRGSRARGAGVRSPHGSRGVNTARAEVAGGARAVRSPHGSRGANTARAEVAGGARAVRRPDGSRGANTARAEVAGDARAVRSPDGSRGANTARAEVAGGARAVRSPDGSWGVNTARAEVAGGARAVRSPHGSRGVNTVRAEVAGGARAVRSPDGSRGVNTARAEVAGGHVGSHRGSRRVVPAYFPLSTLQKRKKCVWGSQDTQKRRTRMKKCGLGDLGAPRRSKALKTQLCDSDPSKHQKTSYTYAKTQKLLFVTFYFFEKMKIKSQKYTFALLHTCTTFFGVLWGPNAPSRSSGAVGALFAPKSHKPHFGIRVRRFLMFLELRNAFGRSKRVLEQLLHFGAPKPSRNVVHV